VWIWLLTSI